jgi:hypothetical protein
VRADDITHRAPLARPAVDGPRDKSLANDEGKDTDDEHTHSDETTSGWTPDRPDAVRVGTPKRNPVIARSVGEPL